MRVQRKLTKFIRGNPHFPSFVRLCEYTVIKTDSVLLKGGRAITLYSYFEKCLAAKYIPTENHGNYCIERIGTVLYIYLECSNGRYDWMNNLDFLPDSRRNILVSAWNTVRNWFTLVKKTTEKPGRPYKRMKTDWKCHRGFLRVWKSIEDCISGAVLNPEIKKIVTVGYSHGAGLAVLCHEYIWYNRPDLRDKIEGYGFGCPRVYWGRKTKEMAERWERFTVIRNIDDIVTHVPPALFGFSHVGKMTEIGEKHKYSCVDAHRPENILAELRGIHR